METTRRSETEHQTFVRTHTERRTGTVQFAKCSCGWTGPSRGSDTETARADGKAHEAAELSR